MTAIAKVALAVGGEPLPKARPRSRAGQAQSYTPPKTREAEKRFRAAFKNAYPDFKPLEGRLMVVVTFYRRTARKVDVDNLVKLPTDALNNLAFVDDEQIEEIHAKRVYGAGDNARTIIRIYELTDSPSAPAGGTEKE